MLFRWRLIVPILAALSSALAVTPSFAQKYGDFNNGIMAPWVPLDVVLRTWPESRRESDPRDLPHTSPEGRRESETFSIRGNTYRLFVRDTGVPTARGPHDRVCVERLADGNVRPFPRLALSTTSAGPDGRRPVDFGRDRLPAISCDLLPPAESYRVWSYLQPGATITPQWDRWQAPAVFDNLEPMLDQDNSDRAMSRNIIRIMEAQQLDGVCLELSVIRVPFSSPDGILDWTMWFEPFWVVGDRMRRTLGLKSTALEPEDAGYVQPARGVVYAPIAPWDSDGPRRYATSEDLPPANGYAHLHTIGFMTTEDIEIYLTERPLDPGQLPIQFRAADCFGDPVVWDRGERSAVELYGFARVSIVVPYWREYSEADADARSYWQTFNNRVLRHELVHAYDDIALLNEAVFRARGHVALRDELKYPPPNAPMFFPQGDVQRQYGTWASTFAGPFFRPYIEDVSKGSSAAAGYFHNAVYGVDALGRRTANVDIDLITPGVGGYGDRAARRRAAVAIYERWVEPVGAAN